MDFLKKYWKVILVGLASLTIGFLLNVYANKKSEQKIIDAITAQINAIKEQQKITRSTPESERKLIELQAQLQLLNSKK